MILVLKYYKLPATADLCRPDNIP